MTTRHPTHGYEPGEMTPGPQPIVNTEAVRAIAREVAEDVCGQRVAEHSGACGQARDLWESVSQLREEQKTMEVQREGDRGELRGVMRAQTRTLAILVAIIGGLGLAAQIVGMVLRVGH